jgi:hypothetical protein
MDRPDSSSDTSETELVRRYDGTERIPLLPLAELIIVSPSADPQLPPDVAIRWNAERLEQPIPGSALWRAVLERRLAAAPDPGDPADRIVRDQVVRCLERFPSLESWWSWVRSGWSAPPPVVPKPAAGGSLARWWRRLRRS